MFYFFIFKMETINFENNFYYLADEVKLKNPVYFTGCSRTIRKIITLKNLLTNNYLYALKLKSGWKLSDDTSKRAKLLLKKDFCDYQILGKKKGDIKKIKEEIQNAPPILELEDEEKFKDAEGNILEIEVRGERHEDKIYFYCKDISEKFKIPNLNEVIIDKRKSYEKNIDYILFGRPANGFSLPIKSLFLTYQGLLRVLFVSRNKNTYHFIKWATKTLFTVQMGEQKEKDKLGSKIQNINYQDFKNVFRKHCNKLSAIYLIKIGKVKDLRNTFNIPIEIPDTNFLYKYGFTDDLNRRFREHCNNFDKYEGVNIDLEMFSFVDQKFNSQAELKIKYLQEAYQKDFQFENAKELIILDEKQEKITKDFFKMISREFAGYSEELQKIIIELKQDIKTLKMSYEIEMLKLKQENELLEKENKYLIEKHQIELENKNLKIKLLELQK